MSLKHRVIHLKQSGELLTDDPSERWTPTALRKAAERIAEVQQNAARLDVGGLLIVSGGGNVPDGFGRGDIMRKKFGDQSAMARYSDVIGRRSTVDNTIMLSAALMEVGVPFLMLAAPKSAFNDIDLGEVKEYNLDLIQSAYREGKVVLLGGGSGTSGQTTDTGVVEVAMWQAKAYPDIPSLALKATKYNGVFEDNPQTNPDVRQYTQVSASFMLSDYDRFSAVDRRCLEIMEQAGKDDIDVRLQVYAATYTISQVLESNSLGTTIYAKDVEAKLV